MSDCNSVWGHEGHEAATYRVTPSAKDLGSHAHLRLSVLDIETEKPIAARLTLTIDEEPYVPLAMNEHGLRFVSMHQRRKQKFTATFARGTGEILIPLPKDARSGTVVAAKGFEFTPASATFRVRSGSARAVVRLRRWIDMDRRGWKAADEHLHYERTDPKHDSDWLTMLDADGLTHGHFLVLKGGNLPGIWADQFAHGKTGEADDGKRLIRPGEEYRDSTQGHINLLGVREIIQPISTGGIGEPVVKLNYPLFMDVLEKTRKLGGIGGPAHGGSLARSSTASLDTVLGHVDFFEIANSHLYKTDVWYQLNNCGIIVPPVAGTDLPNFGFRDPWQPLLGEVRTYVRAGEHHDFESWKQAIHRGEVFVTSGPIIEIHAKACNDGAKDGVPTDSEPKSNSIGPGGVLRLPPEGAEICITARLSSPRALELLELVNMGEVSAANVKRSHENGIHRLTIETKLTIKKSTWLAARGVGQPKAAIEKGLGIKQNVIAHTGVIQVLVGDQAIRSERDVENLRKHFTLQQEFYRTDAIYDKEEHRVRMLKLFDEAILRLDGA